MIGLSDLKFCCKTGLSLFKEILPGYKKVIEYSIYFLILLNIMDITSTYIGIKYFDAYEANERTAYLFNLFGMAISSGIKIFVVALFCFSMRILWKNSEILLAKRNYWLNSVAIISALNAILVMIVLNMVYFFIVLNNIHIIYTT